MDEELLIALLVMWTATTFGIVSFIIMWFAKEGEAFHPHSVDVDLRHGAFLVVNSHTICKPDCVVKSISEFVAPRGSSSSKMCTMLLVVISVAGFLGTSRWYFVNDANSLEAFLSFVGFAALLLVTAFELDVVPERFLDDKLIITGWLIDKLHVGKLPFRLHPSDERFRSFVRESPEIYHLYEEFEHIRSRPRGSRTWQYSAFWPTLHMLGACAYVTLVPTAIILNDFAEEKVGWITGILFGVFCFLCYLTGNYVPVISGLRGWVLMWNPFLREPHFMLKLKRSVEQYRARNVDAQLTNSRIVNSNTKRKNAKLRKRKAAVECSDQHVQLRNEQSTAAVQTNPSLDPVDENSAEFLRAAAEADKRLDSIFLRLARYRPRLYLRTIGKIMVFTELVAMMTPSVAMGLQWVTALCDGPPILSILELLSIVFACLRSGDCSVHDERLQHCIVKSA